MERRVRVGDVTVGDGTLAVFAGPCVLESLEMALEVGKTCQNLCRALGLGYVFKASFDKANRTSLTSFRGPGLEKGLDWLREVRDRLEVPVLTDLHEPWQAEAVGESVDLLQIPAFLCRQTDLLVAAARTGKPVNVKKAQFLAPQDMAPVVEKLRRAGCREVLLCERGTTFGYHQLVVDMRSLPLMRDLGCPVVFDATHSVQMPGGQGDCSGGDRRFVLPLARCAAAAGIDALFLETHPHPEKALSDGPNVVPLDHLERVLSEVATIFRAVQPLGPADLSWCP